VDEFGAIIDDWTVTGGAEVNESGMEGIVALEFQVEIELVKREAYRTEIRCVRGTL